VTTLAAQAAVVAASLTVPVLAPMIADESGADPSLVGFYTSSIFVAAMASSLASPPLVVRWGALRVSQWTLVLAAAGIAALTPGTLPAFAVSAVLIGFAYGPANPASSELLARVTPAHLRARVFSAKQTSVPIGGVLAGAFVPHLASAFSWRIAAAGVAVLCLGIAAALQPWRRRLDADRRLAAGFSLPSVLQPLRLLGPGGGILRLGILSALLAAVQFCFGSVFVTVLTTNGGLSNVTAGAMLSLALGTGIAARLLWGWAADRFTAPSVLAAIAGLMAGACLAVAALSAGWPREAVAAIAILFGASAYSWNGVYLSEVAKVAPHGAIGASTAASMCMTYLGALAGPALFSSLGALTGDGRLGFWLLGAAAVAAIFVALRQGASESGRSSLSGESRTT
jgi:MFS family permease